MSESSAFALLNEGIQKHIWTEGWTELRDAQEQAIPLIVDGSKDVIIAAATAAGKTEAAFLPALTYLLNNGGGRSLIVYISPLKALINDQFGRLSALCENLEITVWPWHGDISSSLKQRFLKEPSGVLLITPESLEALLCNRGTMVASIFGRTAFFVIDELHAFIGSERGKQLQSLLHRIEKVIDRRTPRVGLSATLGDMRLAANFLRPDSGQQVATVESKGSHAELKILVKGYEEPLVVKQDVLVRDEDDEPEEEVIPAEIAADLFKGLRGSNNLVFPNSRREVERYTHLLSAMCADAKVPNEFWPHHGSLSKELRSETEAALKQKVRPATAICTNTLELGIDIGAIRSVAQIGPPPTVASLRQRLGRSGRRKGEPAILRGFCIQQALDVRSSTSERLRLGTVQMAAMISLLLEGWFEPPITQGAHFSTLIQQLLSLVAQNGGVTAGQAYKVLADSKAPFYGIAPDEFKQLLTHLGQKELLQQESSGLMLHGRVGEKLVNHYTFYAAFASDEEYRLVAGGKPLGTLPVSQALRVGQHILFAGRTWNVEEIDEQQKTIYVIRTHGGRPPQFNGGMGRVHTKVRQRMRELLASNIDLAYLDKTAARFMYEGRRAYRDIGLDVRVVLSSGAQYEVVTWLGDSANETIACLLNMRGMRASISSTGIEVVRESFSEEDVCNALRDAATTEMPTVDELLTDTKNLEREKWDWALPRGLLHKAYASIYLDSPEAMCWLRRNFGQAS